MHMASCKIKDLVCHNRYDGVPHESLTTNGSSHILFKEFEEWYVEWAIIMSFSGPLLAHVLGYFL